MKLLPRQVESIIDRNPPQITRDMGLRDAIALITQNASQFAVDRIKSVCGVVLEENHLAGLLTERDIVQGLAQGIDLESGTVGDLLTKMPITLKFAQIENFIANFPQLFQFFQQNQTRHLPIVDNQDNFWGIISDESLYSLFASMDLDSQKSEQSSVITSPIKNFSDHGTLENSLQFCEYSLDSLNLIMGNISEGIIVLSRLGEIIFANPAAEKMFSLPPKQLIGVSLGIPISLDELFEMEIIRRNGEVGVGEVQVSQFFWAQQSCYFVSLRDITARKKRMTNFGKVKNATKL